MAEIRPFRALRYDPATVSLQDVVTQPYDKITAQMQAGYYERHPANFIRFELPRNEPDPYASARKFLSQLREAGILKLEDRPAMYVYEQSFRHPVHPGKAYSRRALITLGRLHDYADGVIFRHEQTLTGPKRDREHLLRTARVQSGLLFMLYDDSHHAVEQLQPADVIGEFTDDLGIGQRLWRITDPSLLHSLQERIAPLPLFIADGHHRYETALSLRRSGEGKFAEDFAMMALVNMRSEGLVVLPTHRTLFGVSQETFQSGLQGLYATFGAKELKSSDRVDLYERLQDRPQHRFAIVVETVDTAHVIDIERAEVQKNFPETSCELDVEILHLLFDQFFDVTLADVTAQRHVRYHRYAEDAGKEVRAGIAQAAFLIRPVTVDTIRDRSLRGALMPQKSTDFYPKMNSGLTLYSWDESFALPQGAAR